MGGSIRGKLGCVALGEVTKKHMLMYVKTFALGLVRRFNQALLFSNEEGLLCCPSGDWNPG